MDKRVKKIFFLICLGGGVLFGAMFFLPLGASLGYSWEMVLLCFGMGMLWAVAFYFIWMLVQKKSKPFTFENPKAQAKLAEYEALRNIPYEQMFCAFIHYGKGLKQAVCETRIYFEKAAIHTAFCYFGKIYHFDIPYSAILNMIFQDDKILIIEAKDVGGVCYSIKQTAKEQFAWLTEKINTVQQRTVQA